MLISLTVENFGSILDAQTFDLTISNKVPSNPDRQLSGPEGVRVPKVAAILGPNGSGKTTVLRAVQFLAALISRSAWHEPERPLGAVPFQNKDGQERATRLSLEFRMWCPPLNRDCTFRYEVTIAPSSVGELAVRRIVSERLEITDGAEVELLNRGERDIAFSGLFSDLAPQFPKSALSRGNASAISIVSQFSDDGHLVKFVTLYFMFIVAHSNFYYTVKKDDTPDDVANKYSNDDASLKLLNEALAVIDVGIEFVSVFKRNSEEDKFALIFRHSGVDGVLVYHEESEGTRNFIRLFPSIIWALNSGSVVLMDELDSDLHPLLIREVVGWFNDPVRNPKGAQLIMSCNNPTIMEELEKDEIFFTQKDGLGRTHIYGLKDIVGVRRGANFMREYLAGRYGAIPVIG